MNEVVILSAVRTPIGRFLGALSGFSAPQLGGLVIAEAIARAGVRPDDLDEAIMGLVCSAGVGQAPARQAALLGGVPVGKGALTINKVCGSGLKAVALAAQAIKAGEARCVVAGGMESMSNVPHVLRGLRTGQKMGDAALQDAMIIDGLWDAKNDFHMGMTAELVCDRYQVTRQAQDAFAAESHRKAIAAIDGGCFADEVLAVEIPQRKGPPLRFDTDESPRRDTSIEGLAKLKAAFKPDGGRVTAGNASGVNDGAAALVVADAGFAKERRLQPMARILGAATGGLEPEWVMMAPVEAIKALNAKLGVTIDDFDLVELNEAFAAQAIAVAGQCRIDPERLNVHGGAVALGHPIGASGARVLTTLLYAMRRRKARRGLAALCLGGGNAVAMAVERIG